jgi:hypothetical protein|tara:strand:+ start:618 stop:1202 length:585 start_codon:yes stop_codon:yes gene_type:complete
MSEIKLFKKYFQKSKIFLYPLLGISKGSKYVPSETYMSWKGSYELEDMKLFCLYKEKCTEKFLKFEKEKLLKNKDFLEYEKLDDKLHLYVFDLTMFPQTWLAVVNGLYSKINEKEKTTILNFFGEKGIIGQTVESYLYPEYYHVDYSDLLNVDIELIENTHEVCDKPNFEKEELKKKGKDIVVVKNNSISLHNK